MKFKITFLFIAPLIFLSCSQEPIESPDDLVANLFNAETSGGQNSVNLYEDTFIAAQNINVGTALVELIDGVVVVTYETEGDWVIEETHLFVGPLSELPTNGAGNPKIGQFPLSETHTGGTTLVVYTTTTPLPLGECVYVAAHAVVTNTVTGESETAWFNGDPIGGNSWAMMSEVCH
ncbi:MAG: hypothetical protein HKN48_09070 [Flavobacteriaceae bacterium]|nr:hypothetical protein [Flavobacteriaceae bacterium]